MSVDFSIIFSTDLFVLSVTRIKIPVVLDSDKTLASEFQIVYHGRVYKLVLFKMDHSIVYLMYSNY